MNSQHKEQNLMSTKCFYFYTFFYRWRKHYVFIYNVPISIFSVTEIFVCGRKCFMWQKLYCVTEVCFPDKNSDRSVFLWRKLGQKLVSLIRNYVSTEFFSLTIIVVWKKLVSVTFTFFLSKITCLVEFLHDFQGNFTVRNGIFR